VPWVRVFSHSRLVDFPLKNPRHKGGAVATSCQERTSNSKNLLTGAGDFLYDIYRQLNIRFSIPESHLEWPRDGPYDATTTAPTKVGGQVPIPTRFGGDERGPIDLTEPLPTRKRFFSLSLFPLALFIPLSVFLKTTRMKN
jgi:hypothetical protein